MEKDEKEELNEKTKKQMEEDLKAIAEKEKEKEMKKKKNF